MAIAVGEFKRLGDANVAALATQSARAGASEKVDIGLRRAIEDGQFEGVEFDVDVVHAAGVERGEHMLGRREQYTLLHQAGGVADARDVADVSLDLEIVEIHAAENDPSVRGSGHQTKMARDGSVKSDSINFDGSLNCELVGHSS